MLFNIFTFLINCYFYISVNQLLLIIVFFFLSLFDKEVLVLFVPVFEQNCQLWHNNSEADRIDTSHAFTPDVHYLTVKNKFEAANHMKKRKAQGQGVRVTFVAAARPSVLTACTSRQSERKLLFKLVLSKIWWSLCILWVALFQHPL